MTSKKDLQELLELLDQGGEFLKRQQYTEALAYFERVLKIDAKSVKALNGKSYALNGLKRYQESLDNIDKAIQIDPNYSPLWVTKGKALELGFQRYEEALNCYEKTLELKPKQEDSSIAATWKDKANPLYELGRYQESIEAVNKALESNLDSVDVGKAVYLKACCYAVLKEDGLALTSLKEAVELNYTFKDWAKKDSDWSHLYSDTRFQEIVKNELNQEVVKKFFNQARQNSNRKRNFVKDWGDRLRDNNLPSKVKKAYDFYYKKVEEADFGTVRIYQITIENVPVYAVTVVTDGDDGYLEIYSHQDEEIACGMNDSEVIVWGDQATTREYLD